MLLRIGAALFTTLTQGLLLWLALYFAVIAARYCDDSIHHHQGIAFGLLIYFLLVFPAFSFAAINLSTALFNTKWLTWLLIVIAVAVVFALFGASPAAAPWRMLFLTGVITPLLLATTVISNFFSRLLVRIGKKFKATRLPND